MYTVTYSHNTERSKTVPVTTGMIVSAMLVTGLLLASGIGGAVFFITKIYPTL